MKLLRNLALFGLLVIGLVLGAAALPTMAADHLDAPLVQQDGRTDLNDLYAFQSPNNPDHTVLIMTVNPAAGVFETSATTFRPHSAYEFVIDNNGDAKTDLQYEVRFFRVEDDGSQRVRLRMRDFGNGGFETIAEGSTGHDVPVHGGGMLHAGLFDDPFFFDLVGFQNFVASGDPSSFCTSDPAPDFFAGLNVTAIVLEVPSHALGADNIGVWARTLVNGPQVDRVGRPAINTVFISSGTKNAYNQNINPIQDPELYGDEVIGTLLALGNDQATAEAIAGILLPDILTVDTSSSAGFLNGRQLTDDVIDTELNLISGGAIPTDCVDGNDVSFQNSFPYLAPPH